MKNVFKIMLFLLMIVCIAVGCMAACNSERGVSKTSCHHKWVEISNTATCQSEGIRTFKCSVCNLSKSEKSDIGNHVELIVEAVEPTCTEYGKTEGKICSVCGEVLVKQEPIPPAHKEVVLQSVQPTCTKDGLTEGLGCSVCGVVFKSQKIVKASHTVEIIPAVEMTCTTDGYTEGTKCSVCGEILEEPVIIQHSHGEEVDVSGYAATCTQNGLTDGKLCLRCNQMTVEQTVIPAAHKEKIVEGYAATCTEDGLTDGKYCSVCEAMLVEQQVITAHHTPVTVKGYAATCSSLGLSDGEKCSACGKIFASQYTLMSDGHDFDNSGKCKNCELRVTDGLEYAPYTTSSYPQITSSEVTAYYVKGFQSGYGADVTTIVIPSKYNGGVVIGIGDGAFENCATVKGIILPGTIISIGKNAFKGCTSLESIECADFSQTENWDESWCGDADNVKLSAMLQNGKTPYEIYVYAMSRVGHNYDKFILDASTTTSYIDNGVTGGYISKLAVRTEQHSRDFHQKITEWTFQPSFKSESSETWYYNGVHYTITNEGSSCLYGVSYEYLLGQLRTDDVPEITEEYFKDAKFYKDADGKLKLECIMDNERIKEIFNAVSGDDALMDSVDVVNIVYKYVFDADGVIEAYYGDMIYTIEGGTTKFQTSTSMEFSEVGTFAGIADPNSQYSSWQYKGYASNIANQNGHSHTVVEVPESPATCFGDGTTAFSYCSTCFQAITNVETIEAGHNFENGECTKCGAFEEENTSRGLAYRLNSDESGYVVVGIGCCKDTEVYIPRQIYGLPVVSVTDDAFVDTTVKSITIVGNTYSIDEFAGWTLE